MFANHVTIHVAQGAMLSLHTDHPLDGNSLSVSLEPRLSVPDLDAPAPPAVILDPTKLPRVALDRDGQPCEPGSSAHAITHFPTAGLMISALAPKSVSSRAQAQQVAADCDLLGRKGDWAVGTDYETQLVIDRNFHEPAVDKRWFPNMPSQGAIYTSRKAAWSADRAWFVNLNYGSVLWTNVGYEGLVVPVLRVPASQ